MLVLTIISPKELPHANGLKGLLKDERHLYLTAFDAISCKFTNYPGALIDKANCERHAWEYLVFRNEAEGAAAGERFGKLCHKHQIKVFWANAEAGVTGTDPYPRTPNPYKALSAFVDAFRRSAPTYTKLAFNGFSWGRTSDGRPFHDAALIKRFDFWSAMNYGTDPHTIERFWNQKNYKYPTGPAVVPMLGVGRIDKSGNTWGFWNTHKDLILRPPGVAGVNWFFGNGAKSQMLQGHEKHPALVECARQLREAGL